MAPAGPCKRFRYFQHFIQPLGGIVTCTPEQLQIVKEGSEAFNGYSFGERKNLWVSRNLCDDVWALFRPARFEPSCLIFPAQQANVTKDLQEKCEYHCALSKYIFLFTIDIFLFTITLHFLIDLIFILQIVYFCSGCLSRSYEIWIQTTFSRWRRCKRIQIVNFKHGKTRAESTWSSCSASGCCAEFVDVAKKIMKVVSLSYMQQVALEYVC